MSQDSPKRWIAVVGNPNAGKSTLFNALTGLRQRVGNYPGVTVEKHTGTAFTLHGEAVELIDLPGMYSMAARSPDEEIAVKVLRGESVGLPKPDAVLCVVDASNLERNLFLVTQVMELGLPVLVALNMVDVAEARGIRLHPDQLSEKLGVSFVPTQAHRGKGLVELRAALGPTVNFHEVYPASEAFIATQDDDPAAGLCQRTSAIGRQLGTADRDHPAAVAAGVATVSHWARTGASRTRGRHLPAPRSSAGGGAWSPRGSARGGTRPPQACQRPPQRQRRTTKNHAKGTPALPQRPQRSAGAQDGAGIAAL
jgi:small GTP-binding protein